MQVQVFDGKNHLGDALAIDSTVNRTGLWMEFRNIHRAERMPAVSVSGGRASIKEVPPRAVHTPDLHFYDDEYPRIAAARRIAGKLVHSVFGDDQRVELGIEPLPLTQGKSRVTIEGKGAEVIKVGDVRYTLRPGELAFAGLVAAYNALVTAKTSRISGFTLPSGASIQF